MSEFRICPHSHNKWKVQCRRFLFWSDVCRYHYEFMFPITLEFDHQQDAEAWIDDELRSRRQDRPRRYP